MPNRIIKESITTSENIAALSHGAECLFYRLMVKADDFGRYFGNAKIVLSTCFPLKVGEISVDDVEKWLEELWLADLLERYTAGGREYIHLTTWSKHQTCRATKSKYPAPSDDEAAPMQDMTRAELVQMYGEETVAKYEAKFSRWAEKKAVNNADMLKCIVKWIRQDGIQPRKGNNEIADILAKYGHGGELHK